MRRLCRLLSRMAHEKRVCRFYSHDPKRSAGQADSRVTVYEKWMDIPVEFRQVAVPSPWLNVMFYRLKRGEAKLLCYFEEGHRLDAYGWVQDWRPFRRKFGSLAENGTMLGPYWTAPEARGRGLYGRLLSHSLALCLQDGPALIYTSSGNLASQRGIEKAGFHFLGEWELRVWLRVFIRFQRVDD